MGIKIFNLLLLVAASAYAQKYQLSRTAVVFGEANGIAVSLIQTLANKQFEVVFVFNGKHHYDSDVLIPKHAAKVITCSMVDSEYQTCEDLVAYAKESKPLDIVIDLQSDSAAEVNAIYTLFETSRKPRLYAVLSSHTMYVPCRDSSDVREYGEYHCPPMGTELVANPADIHASEYETGRRMLEVERELHRLMESRGMSYLALRAAPLFGEREPLESVVSDGSEGEKKSRFLTWLLFSGISAHLNQTIQLSAAYRNAKWSLLYTGEVVKMAGAIDQLANLPAAQPFSRTYNFATVRLTLKKFVTSVLSALGINPKVKVEFAEESELPAGVSRLFYPDFFPSTRVKPVDIGYVQHELRYVPTDFDDALQNTVAFYRDALVNFDAKAEPSHADEAVRVAIDTLVKNGVFTREQVDAFIDRLRNPNVDAGANSASESSSEEQKGHTEL